MTDEEMETAKRMGAATQVNALRAELAAAEALLEATQTERAAAVEAWHTSAGRADALHLLLMDAQKFIDFDAVDADFGERFNAVWLETHDERTGKRRPPVACAQCKTPIAKFFRPGDVWHPCLKCDGAKCEKCYDGKGA